MTGKVRKRNEVVALDKGRWKAWVEIQVGVFPSKEAAQAVRQEVLSRVLPVVADVRNEFLAEGTRGTSR